MTEIEEEKLDRIEVINHFTKDNGRAIGRILTLYKELRDFNTVEFSIQDGGKTLKIFLQ